MDKLKAENLTLKAGMAECQRYSHGWALKIHGVREDDREDIRSRIFDILGKVAQKIRDSLKEGVDVAHRIGQWKQDCSNWSNIILFDMRHHCDTVWKEAKGSRFLDQYLRISRALSTEEKATRQKLWPIVWKVREEVDCSEVS